MTLRIVATGGTFDKHYDALRGELKFGESHMQEIVERVRMATPPVIEVLPLLDSLDMQFADRERILKSCQASEEKHIVIVHGTDTLPETAQHLGASLGTLADKTIVVTGAMVPYEVRGSDALFNLGYACAAAEFMPPGIYVAMHGRSFSWNGVRKNRSLGLFQEVGAAKELLG